ncbi:hypothetical protein [Antiquaquibacter soli]|uniref:Major facilitator superfamily (MFS) profile domain-containing protein n=1 Tax=Antiquaquibacter soli TaxID=3064523 RepID=A0ABT9BLK3_9MICO|nr:hypothetical protein [Protaetiibacter sp. WY-16]MDO7881900.1 hypothetical protein [Protaetiibacter sp. WY-16]
MTVSPAPRRGARLGGWALVLAILGPLWLALTGVLFVAAFSGPDAVGWAATALFFLGFLVIPGSGLVAVGLGIAALAANRAAGKVMGSLALLIVVGAIVLVVWVITSGIASGFSLV